MQRSLIFAFVAATVAFAQSKLAVERLELQQMEDGPALAPGYEFVPGETAHFSCRSPDSEARKKTKREP